MAEGPAGQVRGANSIRSDHRGSREMLPPDRESKFSDCSPLLLKAAKLADALSPLSQNSRMQANIRDLEAELLDAAERSPSPVRPHLQLGDVKATTLKLRARQTSGQPSEEASRSPAKGAGLAHTSLRASDQSAGAGYAAFRVATEPDPRSL